MKPVRALFFDLDDTLLDGSRRQEAIVRTCEMIAANQPGLDAARVLEANAQIWPGYLQEVDEKWTLGALDTASVSLEAWRLTLDACGCGDESLARQASRIHLRLALDARRLFDDVLELFAAAKRARVPLALITNGPSDTQRGKLRVHALEHWFEVVVISGEIGIAKPNASVFDLALNKLLVERESVWHVGDSLTADVAGAKAAGLTAVWINRSGRVRSESDPEPDLEIRSLSNLMGFLSK
jgi:putative hydrolase of the HAD superfamily